MKEIKLEDLLKLVKMIEESRISLENFIGSEESSLFEQILDFAYDIIQESCNLEKDNEGENDSWWETLLNYTTGETNDIKKTIKEITTYNK